MDRIDCGEDVWWGYDIDFWYVGSRSYEFCFGYDFEMV